MAAADATLTRWQQCEGSTRNAVEALKDALSVVFWRKRDLLDYLRASVPDQRLLDGIDWLSPDVCERDSVPRCRALQPRSTAARS